MKKLLLSICTFLLCGQSLFSQEFVTTEVTSRNILIEEFTGKACINCPLGHATANMLVDENPGRIYVVNVHAGYYSTTAYPNLNTNIGDSLLLAHNVGLFPSALINRTTSGSLPYNSWESTVAQQLPQTAECNVAGQVEINPVTRIATVTVEVYYTSDSNEDANYLTIYMLQDSIIGNQTGHGYNPDQVVNGNQYCHQHTLRDVITSTWGDEITPTTAGTLVTKTYEYEIPEIIGDPNGVEIDLDNLHFFAFVTEKHQGNSTNPVLNVNSLSNFLGSQEETLPYLKEIYPKSQVACSDNRTISAKVQNCGTQDITSIKFEYRVDNGDATEFTWEGTIASGEIAIIDNDVNLPLGNHDVEVRIIEANGQIFDMEMTTSVETQEYQILYIDETEKEFTLQIMQDKHGKQTTWDMVSSENEVLLSGGPYNTLIGGSTELHEETIVLHDGDCVKFTIRDSEGDGICCTNGDGYYRLIDKEGNIIIDGDGEFGSEAFFLLNIVHGDAIAEMANDNTTYNIYPNPANSIITIEGENIQEIKLFNTLGQLVKDVKVTSNSTSINIDDIQNGMYIVNIIDDKSCVKTYKVSVQN